MQLKDVYVPFDKFMDEVFHVEKTNKLVFNMFHNELDDPKNYYILHYPYTEASFDRSEMLARLGIMTDAVLNKKTYDLINETDSVRLLLSTGCAKILPFSIYDDVTFTYVPNTFMSNEFLSHIEIAHKIPYTVFATIHYARSDIRDCCVPMGGFIYQDMVSFETSIRAQMTSKNCKVVWLKEI